MQLQLQKNADTIRRLIRREAYSHLNKIMQKTHPADLAHFYRFFTEHERNKLFGLLQQDVEKAAEVIVELESTNAARLLETISPEKITQILQKMDPDDRVDIISQLTPEISDAVMQLLKKVESEEVEHLIGFEENTAGGIMTTEYLALNENLTAKEAIDVLQKSSEVEMFFYLYVVDDRNHLVGVISLRLLIVKPGNTKLKNIMETEVISVHTGEDQEEVARQVARYNILAIPVVDDENKIVGVVTVDDTIDVLRDEATEDFLKMAGTSKEEIIEKSVFSSLKVRSPWLLASLAGGLIAATVIDNFKFTLERIILLSAFLPVIIGMGGNVGIQSTTLMVRGLATGRINIKHIWHVMVKEISVGFSLGICYGVLLSLLVLLLTKFGPLGKPPEISLPIIGLIVGLGIFTSMFIATTVGTFIPILFAKLKVDPALASGPFVTTSIDILGVGSYLMIATILLKV
ncbi:hypothetical protein AMJ80_06520 [bacterium SM23_31]|nr:MAG: hypothetical protein AMJ80_06520 [bacterium SM23_31]